MVIAERVLELHRGDETTPSGFAVARVGLPKPEQATGGRWACSYEIRGLGETFGDGVLGRDSGEALVICLATVGNVLESRARLLGRSIRLQGDERLGFPPMPRRRSPIQAVK